MNLPRNFLKGHKKNPYIMCKFFQNILLQVPSGNITFWESFQVENNLTNTDILFRFSLKTISSSRDTRKRRLFKHTAWLRRKCEYIAYHDKELYCVQNGFPEAQGASLNGTQDIRKRLLSGEKENEIFYFYMYGKNQNGYLWDDKTWKRFPRSGAKVPRYVKPIS